MSLLDSIVDAVTPGSPGGAAPSGVKAPTAKQTIAAEKENEAVAFNEQCFLFEHMEAYSGFRKKSGGFKRFIAVDGEPSELVNAITNRPGIEELLQLTTAYKSLLVPKIKLLKIVHKKGPGCRSVELPIPFKQHYTLNDIADITKSRQGRGSGIGIKDVDLIFDGKDPVQAKVFVECNMSFYFHNMKDLLDRFTVTVDGDDYEVGPVDLIMPLKAEKAQNEGSRLDFKDFQIQLILGWNILDNPDPNYSLQMPQSLVNTVRDNTSLKLWLQLKRHKLDFNQDGSFMLNVEYQAAVASVLNNPSTNVLVADQETLYNMGPTVKTKNQMGKVSMQSRDMARNNADNLELQAKLVQKAIKKQTKLENEGNTQKGKLGGFGWKDDEKAMKNLGFFKKLKEAMDKSESNPSLPATTELQTVLKRLRSERAEINSMRRGAKYQTFITMLLGGCERHEDDRELGFTKQKRKKSTCMPKIFVEKVPKELVGMFTDVVANTDHMKSKRSEIFHKIKSKESGGNAGSKNANNKLEREEAQRDVETKLKQAVEKRAKKQANAGGDEDAGKLGNDIIDASGNALKGEVDDDGSYRFYYMFFGDILDVMFTAAFIGTDRSCNDLSKIKVLVGPFAKGGTNPAPNSQLINLADVPISLNLFMNWFLENVVKKNLDTYLLADVIRDLVAGLIKPALGDGCFKGVDHKVSVKMGMYLGPADAKGEDRLRQIAKKGRLSLNSGARSNLLQVGQHPDGAMTNYFLIYASTFDTKNLDGNPETDAKKGIYHFYMGAEGGLVKNFSFARDEVKGSAEANIIERGMVTPEKGLGDSVYNCDIDMIGNFLFVPGQMIFVNPSIIGLGNASSANSYAYKLRLGGYYLVTKVSNKVSTDNFDTRITCRWVGFHPGPAKTSFAEQGGPSTKPSKKSLDKKKK